MEVDHPYRLLTREYSDTEITADTQFASMVSGPNNRWLRGSTMHRASLLRQEKPIFAKSASEKFDIILK